MSLTHQFSRKESTSNSTRVYLNSARLIAHALWSTKAHSKRHVQISTLVQMGGSAEVVLSNDYPSFWGLASPLNLTYRA